MDIKVKYPEVDLVEGVEPPPDDLKTNPALGSTALRHYKATVL